MLRADRLYLMLTSAAILTLANVHLVPHTVGPKYCRCFDRNQTVENSPFTDRRQRHTNIIIRSMLWWWAVVCSG